MSALDHQIVRTSKYNQHLTAPDILGIMLKYYNIHLSNSTIQRRLRAAGLMGRVAWRKPFISLKNRLHRQRWCKERRNWPSTIWNQVVWTDESVFHEQGNDVRFYIRRRVGEEFDPHCTKATVKGGGSKVTVWACMTATGPGPIIRIDGIMDQYKYKTILEQNLKPWIQRCLPRRIPWQLVHDNDPKHKAKSVTEWLNHQRWTVMDWPAQSPDLNVIEHCWGEVDKVIRDKKPGNNKQLWKVVENAWNDLSASYCQKLVNSMHERCESVLKKRGYASRL